MNTKNCDCDYEDSEVRHSVGFSYWGKLVSAWVIDRECKKCGTKTVKFIFKENI